MKDIQLDSFLKLFLIRSVENFLAEKKKNGEIATPVHLSAGQECAPVCLYNFKKKGDIIFGNHRSHHHVIPELKDLSKFFAEILCKKDGLSKGFGGSMHLVDKKNGFYGSAPIVGGTIPIATGLAFSLKKTNSKNNCLVFFGDGAVDEGIFHESLFFASKNSLPIIYVLENNQYASNVHYTEKHFTNNLANYADGYKIKKVIANGMDFFDSNKKSKITFDYINKTRRPVLIEFKCYRYYGHVDWRQDIDVGVGRSKIMLNKMKKKDPIIKLEKFLIKNSVISKKSLDNKKEEILNQINISWCKTKLMEDHKKSDLLKYTYPE